MISRRFHLAMLTAIVAAAMVTVSNVPSADAATNTARKVNAIVASFDPYAGADQRFIVGLIAGDGRNLAFGQVKFQFAYAGTREQPLKNVTGGPPIEAAYQPVPGQKLDPTDSKSRLVAPSKSRGVYGTDTARFDKPGLWAVLVSGRDGKRRFTANAVFDVSATAQVAAPGEPAPRSANALPGSAGVPLKAIDSRASSGTVPDPELHTVSVADAIAAAKPVMVVVSTPVYCVSRFCGPITDTIQKLARQYGDRMSFVHLEVWRNFPKQQVNDAAGEWVYRRDQGGASEPWVFVVDGTGTVTDRFDNVATEEDLQGAIKLQVQ